MSDFDQIEQQAMATATSVFALNNDYYKWLLYYELDICDPIVDQQLATELSELNFKERITQSDKTGPLVQQVYVLYGDKRALIFAKPETDLDHLDEQIRLVSNLPHLRRKAVPSVVSFVPPLLLVSEISDNQLRLLSENKNDAIKKLEAKTGLRLKKVKKTFFFSGLLFQFEILNEMLNDAIGLTQELSISTTAPSTCCIDSSTSSFVSVSSSLNNENLNFVNETMVRQDQVSLAVRQASEEPKLQVQEPTPIQQTAPTPADWRKLYQESKVSFNLKIKPKNVTYTDVTDHDFVYDVYIFQADLTDLNTDGLVNANQSNLHPGYSTGDGISQRIREKGGKLMSDACKKIRASRSDHLVPDSEVVVTKASGKLRTKYVLHAIEPKWTKHIVEAIASEDVAKNDLIDRYEALLEQTFSNVLVQAHKPELQIRSIAYPCASSAAGGAFDVPIKLLAHVIYTQLVDYPVTIRPNEALATVCITSLEDACVQTMGEIFQNYTECYSTSSWAIPTSPMAELLIEARAEFEKAPKAEKPSKANGLVFDSLSSDNITGQHPHPQVTILTRQRKRNDSSLTDACEMNELEAETVREQNSHTNHQHDDNRRNHFNGSGHYGSNENDSTNADRRAKFDHHRTSNHHGKSDSSYVNPLADRLGPKVTGNNKRTRGGFKPNEDEVTTTRNHHGQHYQGISNFGPSQPQAAASGGQFHSHNQNFVNNRSRQNSNSSSNYSSSYENSGHLTNRRLDSLDYEEKNTGHSGQARINHRGKSCLFCQSEVSSKIVECGNPDCPSAFCLACVVDHLNKQKSQKCPSCKGLVGKEIAARLLSNRLASTSPTRQPTTHPFNKNNNYNNITNLPINQSHKNHKTMDRDQQQAVGGHSNGITQGVIKIRNIAEPCEGFEGYESLMITFDIQDGIQNVSFDSSIRVSS